MTTLVWLVIALPLAGAAILLLAGRRSDAWGHLLGCLAALASFAAGVVLFVDMLGRHAEDRVVAHHVLAFEQHGDAVAWHDACPGEARCQAFDTRKVCGMRDALGSEDEGNPIGMEVGVALHDVEQREVTQSHSAVSSASVARYGCFYPRVGFIAKRVNGRRLRDSQLSYAGLGLFSVRKVPGRRRGRT